MRLIINIGPPEKDTVEIEFWPDRQQAQVRETTRQGVVHASPQIPLEEVVALIKSALAEARAGLSVPTSMLNT